jgi:hypothetical protein
MPQINAPIRARDLRHNVSEMGFEKGVMHTLELLLEEFSEQRQNMRSLAQMMDLCVQQIENMVKLNDAFKHTLEEMQRTMQPKDEA